MDSEDIKRLEFKIDLLLKGFLSFYGGDDSTYAWDHAFDEMKNEVKDDLIQLLDLPKDDVARKAFIDSFGTIPYNGRRWWKTSMNAMLQRKGTRLQALETVANISSLYRSPSLPTQHQTRIRAILREGKSKEINAITRMFSAGIDYSDKTPLLGKAELLILTKDKNESNRVAVLKAIHERLQKSDSFVDSELAKGLLPLSKDTSEKVIDALVPILEYLSSQRYNATDLTPLLTSKNDRVRYVAVCQYLGYTSTGWVMGRKVDLKRVAKLMSDPYGPISKIAGEYLDKAQSSERF